MADSSTRILSIELPAALRTTGGADTFNLAIVADDQIAGSKRAISRSYLDANTPAPGRIRTAEWEVWGPGGASIESSSGGLGIDFAQNLDTRWERRLISAGKQNSLDLTSLDPPGMGAYFGTAYFGTSYFGGPLGGGSGESPPVVVFAEQQGYLLVFRGRLLTQVDMSTTPWTVISTTVLDADVRDADHWRGTVKAALGPTAAMRRITGVSSTGVTTEAVTATSPAETVYASAIKRGSDRAWYINANQAQSSYNYAGFTPDDFVNLASLFQVGDPEVGTTGIGPFGPFTQFGQEDQISTFTDQGKPFPQSRALTSIHSPLNGKQFADPGWSWNYYTSVAGLRANAGGVDNPVGVGERMRGFTGHNGLPQSVYQVRGELPVVYQTEAGDLYGYRCTFGPQTGGSGQPVLWPWFYDDAEDCNAIFSSTTGVPDAQGVWLIRAQGTNLTYELIAANGRDDLYSEYVYSITGGVGYLTTLDRNPNLLKTFRVSRFRTRNLTTGSSWALGLAFDANPIAPTAATYTTIGTVTTNGQQTLLATGGGLDAQGNPTPTANISGRTMKPRVTQIAAGSGAASSPPEIDGLLEIEYEERPDQIEVVEVAVNLTGTAYSDALVWDLLRQLSGSQTSGPFKIQLPDDPAPAISGASGGGQKYAMVAGVEKRQDIKDDAIEAVSVTLHVWPQAEALAA